MTNDVNKTIVPLFKNEWAKQQKSIALKAAGTGKPTSMNVHVCVFENRRA